MPATAEISEPIQKRTDERKIARNLALVRLGHEAVMLDKIQRQAAYVLDLAKSVRDGTMDTAKTDQEAPAEDEEMGVNIGNETHFHVQAAEKKDELASQTPAEPARPPVTPTATGWLPTLVTGAALLAGGSGVGYIVHDLLTPGPVTQAQFVDTDTSYEIRLPP